MEVAYYNERLSVWEPLIEEVEDKARHRSWELKLEVGILMKKLCLIITPPLTVSPPPSLMGTQTRGRHSDQEATLNNNPSIYS